MEIRYGALQESKPGSNASQCEDAFAYSDASSLVAVCDGAGTAFESRLWARLLARGFVEQSPLGRTDDDLFDWADFIAAQWSQSIPWEALNVFHERKARSGSAATLVGLQLTPPPQDADSGTWRCLALGDSCLFQVSRGRLVEALPLSSSGDFNSRPPVNGPER
jgi:serine/threonine protein phosphatase PrpC